MRNAQLLLKHNAYRAGMQVAYAINMEKEEQKESLRRIRRRTRLGQLVTANGGATMVANESGTPKSHISAMLSGSRGLGDVLASKLESLYALPAGWFDAPDYMEQAAQFDQWQDKQPPVTTRAHPASSMIQAPAPVDKAASATETIAPDVRVLMRVLDALPLEQRENAFSAALQVLVQYLPRAGKDTQEQALGVTQASTHD